MRRTMIKLADAVIVLLALLCLAVAASVSVTLGNLVQIWQQAVVEFIRFWRAR